VRLDYMMLPVIPRVGASITTTEEIYDQLPYKYDNSWAEHFAFDDPETLRIFVLFGPPNVYSETPDRSKWTPPNHIEKKNVEYAKMCKLHSRIYDLCQAAEEHFEAEWRDIKTKWYIDQIKLETYHKIGRKACQYIEPVSLNFRDHVEPIEPISINDLHFVAPELTGGFTEDDTITRDSDEFWQIVREDFYDDFISFIPDECLNNDPTAKGGYII